MKTQTATSKPRAEKRASRATFIAALLPAFLLLFTTHPGHAGSATWAENANYFYDVAANWTPQTVPDGPSDTATFATSVQTFVYVSDGDTIELNGITFNPGADAFTIELFAAYTTMTFSGAGIVNNSGVVQTFAATGASDGAGYFYFKNSATVGSLVSFIIDGGSTSSTGSVGFLYFNDTSSAGDGSFTLVGASDRFFNGGFASFEDNSSMGNATFTMEGATAARAHGGKLVLTDNSTAAQGNLIATGSTARGSGSIISFERNSLGGTARVQLLGNAHLEIYKHHSPGVTIGSLEGNGVASLGLNNLTIGSNNLSTTFAGPITGLGSVTKVGSGKLILTNDGSSYTAGTTVSQGTLSIGNTAGSSTGSGPVTVTGGSLAGTGIIAGAVSVGTGTGHNAVLSPGSKRSLGTLTILNPLTFNSDGTYAFALSSDQIVADQVVANGVAINGASFSPVDNGATTLTPGTVFTVINNTAAVPITGTFSNLPDGSTLTIGSNTYQVSYEGGDGNDLTLTVVP